MRDARESFIVIAKNKSSPKSEKHSPPREQTVILRKLTDGKSNCGGCLASESAPEK